MLNDYSSADQNSNVECTHVKKKQTWNKQQINILKTFYWYLNEFITMFQNTFSFFGQVASPVVPCVISVVTSKRG